MHFQAKTIHFELLPIWMDDINDDGNIIASPRIASHRSHWDRRRMCDKTKNNNKQF